VAIPPLVISQRRGIGAFLEALRPRQWTKNVFVFAGLIFSGRLFDRAAALREVGAFAVFCAAASAVYLANDAADRDHDARHPIKRGRPVASGRLAPSIAIAASVVLGVGALAASAALSVELVWIVASYLALSVAYSVWLKRVFLVDVMIVACGFVLRAAAGAAAIPVEISPWLLCCSFLLALFLALAKRRAELSLLGNAAVAHRASLTHYSIPLLDGWLTALTGATIVSYALYTQSPRTVEHFGTTNLLYTLPFVIYALFRYQQVATRDGSAGDPGALLAHEPSLLIALAGWALTAAFVIYR
jgi:4-hydroxybenzoate polyprenyltransferase